MVLKLTDCINRPIETSEREHSFRPTPSLVPSFTVFGKHLRINPAKAHSYTDSAALLVDM
jgi:hypothetical protein